MRYLVYWEHKLHDNGPNSPAVIYAKDDREAASIFDRDNPNCYATYVEEDLDYEDDND